MTRDIKSLYTDELKSIFKELGLESYRASQVFKWLHAQKATSFDEMTNLSVKLRGELAKEFDITALKIELMQESAQDGTRKYLFKLADGNYVESVLLPYEHGNSVCVSSQVGCRMGCKFCASTLGGLTRNLTASEILDQIYAIERDTGKRVSNIVVMGTGEPLDNYDNLIRFIKLVSDENGLNISKRNITVSSCGICENIKRLAGEDLPITFALSLHAVTDEKRREIMPIANRYSIAELMDAVRFYFDRTGRRVTFEYSLIEGVNDTDEDAAGLSKLAGDVKAHVNLIPVNPIKERDYRQTSRRGVEAFKNKLEKSRINVTIRREMGRDIDGACGQLRKKTMDEE